MTKVAAPRHAFLFEQLSMMSETVRASLAESGQRTLLRERLRKETVERIIAVEISSRRLRGDSFGSIAQVLNDQGWKGRNGGRWYASSVRNYFFRKTERAIAFGRKSPEEEAHA